jgi:Flp pilus assembly protein TadG
MYKMKNLKQLRNKYRGRSKLGVAAVEFAVISPVLVLLFFGTIEACRFIYLRQTLTIAAYEATRTALVPKTTSAQVIAAAKNILTDRGVKDAVVTITPSAFDAAPIQSFIEVRVTAPANSNSLVQANFFEGKFIVGRCSMMKEY